MMNIRDRQSENSNPSAIILAAGQGTRMAEVGESALPKVVYPVAGEPMVRWVVRACRQAGVGRCVVVVGYKGRMVRDALAEFDGVEFVEQAEQRGTAHAVQMAQPLFEDRQPGDVFVLAGDGPLVRRQTLVRLLELHRRTHSAMTLATAVIDDPTGYGRVVRDAEGRFDRIVEHKDASAAELAIREVNPSYYCFDSAALFEAIGQVRSDNEQGEYYITDAPSILKSQGKTVSVIEAVPPQDVLSINTPQQLAEVDRILRRRQDGEQVATGTEQR